MKRNNKGWKFCFQHDNGQCDPTGQPFLFKTLDHDSINYPEGLGGYMGYLWREAREKNMSVSEIQEKLAKYTTKNKRPVKNAKKS